MLFILLYFCSHLARFVAFVPFVLSAVPPQTIHPFIHLSSYLCNSTGPDNQSLRKWSELGQDGIAMGLFRGMLRTTKIAWKWIVGCAISISEFYHWVVLVQDSRRRFPN